MVLVQLLRSVNQSSRHWKKIAKHIKTSAILYSKGWVSFLTNRDRYLMKRNEYDILCDVQLALLHGENCIIDALIGNDKSFYSCPEFSNNNETTYERCCRCIAAWLNNKED